MQLPNSSGHGDGRRKKSKTGEDGSYCTAHVNPDFKGVVYVGVVLSLKPILKSSKLCLSFKVDVLTLALTSERNNMDHELLSASPYFVICT